MSFEPGDIIPGCGINGRAARERQQKEGKSRNASHKFTCIDESLNQSVVTPVSSGQNTAAPVQL
jgi:hypothetical protein